MSSRPDLNPSPDRDAATPAPALGGGPGHALNNLLAKILGSAELALDRVSDPGARAHLESIMTLAETGGEIVHQLQAPAPRRRHSRRPIAGPDIANSDQTNDAVDPSRKARA